MAYSLEMIEWLHDNGKMPDWAYYQQNGKSADHNLREQRDRFIEKLAERERKIKEKKEQEEMEKEIEKKIEKELDKAVEVALEELLKGFSTK